MAGSGKISHPNLHLTAVIMPTISRKIIMILECSHFISSITDVPTLTPCTTPVPTAATGLLQLMILTALTTWVLFRLIFIRLITVSVFAVTPSVVLLDNHTTNRYRKYGWKWEYKPANQWQSYYANYLELNKYDIRTQPLYFLYGGRIEFATLNCSGVYSYYWSSTASSGVVAYDLYFTYNTIFPAKSDYRYYGNSIRCLAR